MPTITSHTNKLLLCFSLILFSCVSHAEIFKWVDEDGKIHYGDRRGASAQTDIQTAQSMDVQDHLSIEQISALTPRTLTKADNPHLISIEELSLDLGDDNQAVLIGRITTGIGCDTAIPIYRNEGYLDISDDGIMMSLREEFLEQGYNVNLKAGAVGGAHLLTASIIKINSNTCLPLTSFRKGQEASVDTSTEAYVKIKWTLTNSYTKREIFSGETEGYNSAKAYDAPVNVISKSYSIAIEMALNNLLANDSFVSRILRNNPSENTSIAFNDSIQLNLPSNRGGPFRDKATYLTNTSVTVKTQTGHGSGVFISDDGYLLTNAHVVGEENTVTITSNGGTFTAKVIRVEPFRDVALVKVESFGNTPQAASLATAPPAAGHELYIIGTPLDEELGNTITKGILSAKREINGLKYFQTDASINPGNSGGPVFNQDGELVALAVSGVFNRHGASLNVNYLIPINDALGRLNIEDTSHQDISLEQAIPEVRSHINNAVNIIQDLLD